MYKSVTVTNAFGDSVSLDEYFHLTQKERAQFAIGRLDTAAIRDDKERQILELIGEREKLLARVDEIDNELSQVNLYSVDLAKLMQLGVGG